jgi:2-dehydro-3-deoxyphosphooctonate aldolase (KDO 8-P synthase)
MMASGVVSSLVLTADGGLALGTNPRLVLIAGPCTLESPEVAHAVAGALAAACAAHGVDYVFKGSFDKANRSRGDAYRGPGMREGLALLADVRRAHGVPITTDVHEVGQVGPVAEVVDLIQVPAFLCRQTDLLQAAGASGRVVNVKKGQFLPPADVPMVLEKVGGPAMITERGSCFGHGDLVVDFRGVARMMRDGAPVCFDATHSAQARTPGAAQTGGDREAACVLGRAAVAVGVGMVFAEVHPEPEQARSDAATQLSIERLRTWLPELVALHRAVR